ncbi:MAG: hypothetical protein HXM20_00770 [Granulicatella sp.]|nr:hypothetical protein [Granulicatella sp.]
MKRKTYNILTKIPIYGTFLKHSLKRGQVILCSPLLEEIGKDGLNSYEIFQYLEEKYPGEVVTNERFAEGWGALAKRQKQN